MANVIRLKRSSAPSGAPLTTDLVLGELAVNTYDGNIFLKKSVSGTDTIVKFSTYQLTNDTVSLTLQSDGSVEFPNFTFPKDDGTANQFLVTDGAGNLSWSSTLTLDNLIVGKTLGVGTSTVLNIYAITFTPDPLGSGLTLVQIQTTTDHGLNNSDYVTLFGIVGTAELNNLGMYVSVDSTDTFTLYADASLATIYDGTTLRPYVSDGYVYKGNINFGDGSRQSFRAPRFWNNNMPIPNTDPIDLREGDFYYDDLSDSLYVYAKFTPSDGSDVYYDFKDITVRNA